VPPELPRDLVETASSGPSADGTRTPEDTARAPVLADGIRLRRLARWQTEGVEEDIADLAMASVADTPGTSFHGRGEFLRHLAVSARRPGFALLVAETTVLVGCAYGFPLGPDGRDIARRLQQRLLTDRHIALGVALLHPADQAGHAAFESWGWQNMGQFVGLPGPVAPCVLTLLLESPSLAGQ
jgi:hypothetical protein